MEGQKASLESELQASSKDLEQLPAQLDEAMAAADQARANAQMSADKVPKFVQFPLETRVLVRCAARWKFIAELPAGCGFTA